MFSMNYEYVVPLPLMLSCLSSYCKIFKAQRTMFISIAFLFWQIPIEKDLAIFASSMNRILRIPKRMYDGIKNSEQFERRTSQNCKKINYAHLAMTWHCVPSIIYKTTLMGILKNYQGRYLSLTTRQHLFFEMALDYTIRHTLYVPWLNCNLRWCCDKIDLQFWYCLAIMKTPITIYLRILAVLDISFNLRIIIYLIFCFIHFLFDLNIYFLYNFLKRLHEDNLRTSYDQYTTLSEFPIFSSGIRTTIKCLEGVLRRKEKRYSICYPQHNLKNAMKKVF